MDLRREHLFQPTGSWNGALTVDIRDWTPDEGKLIRMYSFGIDTSGEMYLLTADDVFQVAPIR